MDRQQAGIGGCIGQTGKHSQLRYRQAGLAIVLLLPGFAGCWPFGDDSKAKEKEVSTLSVDASDVFVRLAGERSRRTSELEVIARLSTEKKTELAGIDEQLRNRYGMDPGQVYMLDATNRAIQLVVSKPPAQAGGKPTQEKIPHRVFPDDKSCDEFFNVVLAKRMTVRQIEVFDELVREKTMEMSRVKDALKQRFQIDPERNYRYDAKTRKVYEVLPPKAEKPAPAPTTPRKKLFSSEKPPRPTVAKTGVGGLPTAQDVRAPFEKGKTPVTGAKGVKSPASSAAKK